MRRISLHPIAALAPPPRLLLDHLPQLGGLEAKQQQEVLGMKNT
jgi:hypothetical protein